MKFSAFITSLFPSFKRDEVIDAATNIRKSIMEHSIVAYRAATEAIGEQKLISKEMQRLEKIYKGEVKMTRKSMVIDITAGLENALNILEFVVKNGKTIYSENEASAGLTFRKATIMRVITVADYANKFSLDLLNYLYTFEAKATKGGEETPGMIKAEIDLVESGFIDFCRAIAVLKTDMSSLQDSINSLPEATVSELTEKTYVATIGSDKVDPLGIRNFSVRKNPFFVFEMMNVEKQVKKYYAKKEMLELIQLRLLNLQKLKEKTQDAALDKEIAYYQDRVTSLNHDLDKMSKEYGL